ncbi:copia protein [Tanacetum coccineum]
MSEATKKKNKGHLLDDLRAIAVKKKKKRPKTKLVLSLKHLIRYIPNRIYSDALSSLDDLEIDIEYHRLCQMSLKVINKYKSLKTIINRLEKEILELKEKESRLEKNKETDIGCTTCQNLIVENEKIKEEASKLTHIEKNILCKVICSEEDSEITKDGKVIVEESLNVTFDESHPPPITSPLEDDDLVEEEAIEVFRNKLDENGIESRNKARLVAEGYNQQEGIDYDETYALVARL